MRYGHAGRWWRFVPREQWPTDEDGLRAVMKHWDAEVGDCRQELVFIGQGIDFERLHAELDACLLDAAELAQGTEGWSRLVDLRRPGRGGRLMQALALRLPPRAAIGDTPAVLGEALREEVNLAVWERPLPHASPTTPAGCCRSGSR